MTKSHQAEFSGIESRKSITASTLRRNLAVSRTTTKARCAIVRGRSWGHAMTPELKRVRLALLILAAAWLMQAILAQVILYNHGRQAEAFQARLEQLEAKVVTSRTK